MAGEQGGCCAEGAGEESFFCGELAGGNAFPDSMLFVVMWIIYITCITKNCIAKELGQLIEK